MLRVYLCRILHTFRVVLIKTHSNFFIIIIHSNLECVLIPQSSYSSTSLAVQIRTAKQLKLILKYYSVCSTNALTQFQRNRMKNKIQKNLLSKTGAVNAYCVRSFYIFPLRFGLASFLLTIFCFQQLEH